MEQNYYEFKIWSRRAPDEDMRVPKLSDHEMVAEPTVGVTFADIPAQVLLSAEGIGYLTVIRVTPYPSETALGYARKFALKLAQDTEGVLEDNGAPERFTYMVDKILSPAINEYTPMLEITVWFEGGRGIGELSAELVELFAREFPAALPTKYGVSVPPVFEFSDTESGRNSFADFLRDTPTPVWYGHSPVTHVHLNDARRNEAARAGLRVDRISVRIPDAMYEVEEWKFAMRRLLKSMTLLTGAFFGQICRGESGIISWWWQGLPLELGVACTIGDPYYTLIPDCVALGEQIGERVAYFEEPNGPFISKDLLSLPKKRIFKKNAPRLYPEDFTLAERLPIGRRADE